MDLRFKTNNKKVGNSFEKEMAEILANKGYWVTLLTPKTHVGSQPADLIAVKNNKAMLIDCKTCNKYLFPISRIEQNQIEASKKYLKCGNTEYYIAIKYKEYVYAIPIAIIDVTKNSIDLRTQMKWRFKNENYSK